MPKPLINHSPQINTQQLDLKHTQVVTNRLSSVELDRRFRVKRSKGYIESVSRLDIGGSTMNKAAFDALVEAIRREFPEVSLECLPIGIVAKCYLGEPFEVHTLDIYGSIIKHYKRHESLPPLMERARSLAMHGSYVFIEVYTDALRAITNDGSVSVVKG